MRKNEIVNGNAVHRLITETRKDSFFAGKEKGIVDTKNNVLRKIIYENDIKVR